MKNTPPTAVRPTRRCIARERRRSDIGIRGRSETRRVAYITMGRGITQRGWDAGLRASLVVCEMAQTSSSMWATTQSTNSIKTESGRLVGPKWQLVPGLQLLE